MAVPRRPVGGSVARVGLAIAIAFGGLAAGAGYWQVVQAPPLSAAPDNPAVVAAARQVLRGPILDRDGTVLASNERDRNNEPYRVYKDPVMSPVIGYASRLFGSAGIERAYEAQLTGLTRPDPVQDLLKKFEADPTDPQALTLTISLKLQRAAVKALGRDRGAVVMLDPRSGEILALASNPIYDASEVANPSTSEKAFADLQASSARPLLSRATQGRYVPGSIFKIVTAIGGLGSGAFTPETTFPGQRRAEREGLVVSGFRIREHAGVPVRTYTLATATEVSSNIWFALAGLETGGEQLADWAGRVGFRRAAAVRPADGAVPGHERGRQLRRRLQGRRRARERRLWPGGDRRDAAPDGARRRDRRE